MCRILSIWFCFEMDLVVENNWLSRNPPSHRYLRPSSLPELKININNSLKATVPRSLINHLVIYQIAMYGPDQSFRPLTSRNCSSMDNSLGKLSIFHCLSNNVCFALVKCTLPCPQPVNHKCFGHHCRSISFFKMIPSSLLISPFPWLLTLYFSEHVIVRSFQI